MFQRALPTVVVATAVAAAWFAARTAWLETALWLTFLLAILAIQPGERRLLSPRWATAGLLLLALSWTVALDHELAARLSLLVVAGALLFGLARLAAPSDRHLFWLAVALAGTAAVGVWQLAAGFEQAGAALDQLPAALREAAAARLAGARAFATSSLPGHAAALLLLPVPLLVSAIVRERGARRILAVVAGALALGGIVATRSLAGVALAGALLVLAALGGGARRWVLPALALLAAAACAVVLLRHDLARVEPVVLRWLNWRTAFWVFTHRPLTGVGLGGVGQAGLLAPTAAGNITPYAHNTYLELLAGFGVAGVGALLAGIAGLVALIRRGLEQERALALAVAVVPLHNLVDFSAWAPEVLLPWCVLAGALAARVLPAPRRHLPSALLVPVLAAGLVGSALAWRGESAAAAAIGRTGQEAVETLRAAARWTPWQVTPLIAAVAALDPGVPAPLLRELDEALTARAWVRPVSSAWAEAKARIALAAGRRGEALAWAREARRRAPTRADLEALEAACSR